MAEVSILYLHCEGCHFFIFHSELCQPGLAAAAFGFFCIIQMLDFRVPTGLSGVRQLLTTHSLANEARLIVRHPCHTNCTEHRFYSHYVLIRMYFDIFFVHYCVTICSIFSAKMNMFASLKQILSSTSDTGPVLTEIWSSGLEHMKNVQYLAAKWVFVVNRSISKVYFILSVTQLSPGDGEHVSVATHGVECSRSPAAGVTFPLLLLNLINYGSEQKPRERGDRKPTTLSEPWGDCE